MGRGGGAPQVPPRTRPSGLPETCLSGALERAHEQVCAYLTLYLPLSVGVCVGVRMCGCAYVCVCVSASILDRCVGVDACRSTCVYECVYD